MVLGHVGNSREGNVYLIVRLIFLSLCILVTHEEI
jgi:hypothetical protein